MEIKSESKNISRYDIDDEMKIVTIYDIQISLDVIASVIVID